MRWDTVALTLCLEREREREKKRMKSYAQALDLKDDPQMIEAYIQYHKNVWPEVLKALTQIGISKMKIFLLGTHLFMYFEVRHRDKAATGIYF